MASDEHLSPQTHLVVELLRLGGWLQREGDRIAAEFGLKQQQVVVLNQLVLRGPLPQKELVSTLLLEKSGVSKLVHRLVEKGLAEIVPHPTDKRVTRLRATRRGRSLLRRCLARFEEFNTQWISALPEEEIARAAKILTRLRSQTQRRAQEEPHE